MEDLCGERVVVVIHDSDRWPIEIDKKQWLVARSWVANEEKLDLEI